ncbi:hypothetical protein IMSAG249_00815 [Lachnospiraceae bacterium]|jgi:sortase B|nr:class B sortase [Lachnospiraceae bacterium]GFI18631.1 hypothetical protein IMSAGC009_03807 [Lachnospiraceae bacterium]GFI68994.1 hypothetical protein IMSAG249_00815 [Lachnospiraceae bacterium]
MKKSKIWLLLFGTFAATAVVGGIFFAAGYLNRQKANKAYEEMQAVVNSGIPEENQEAGLEGKKDGAWQEADGDTLANESGAVQENGSAARAEAPPAGTEEGLTQSVERNAAAELSGGKGNALSSKPDVTVTGKNLDWDALHKENADIYAWISVPGTTVDYPVLQHPTSNAYYLNRNMDGSKGYPGCIYTENYNSKDFSDLHTVVYGHNLKDKTMFSTLHNFGKDKLVQEPHYIYVYTESGVFTYEIFAAYEFPAIHLLVNYDLTNEYVYAQYIKDILNMDSTNARVANIRHDIEVTEKDKIITLSTCTTDHDASLRFLVVGVLRNS